MKTLRDRLEYRPQRVTLAAAKVFQLHPDPGSATVTIGPVGSRAVRERLEEAQATGRPEALETLARELTRAELRVVARGVIEWQDLVSAAERVLVFRGSPEVNPILWSNVVAAPDHGISARILSDLIAHPRALWPSGGDKESLLDWLSGTDVPDRVRTWLDGEMLSLDEERNRVGSLLGRESRLTSRVAGRILQNGARLAIQREPSALLQWGWEVLPPEGRIAAGQNYLQGLPPTEWDDGLCREIRDSYGLPRAPTSRQAFWGEVPEEVRRAFQQRFILEALERAFFDHDRKRYWMQRWADSMTEVFDGSAGGTQYVIMLFPGFGVVEFFETGNAAYFYDLETALKFSTARPWSPAGLKRKYRYDVDRRAGFSDNRLIHSRDWYSTADRRVARWLSVASK